MAQHIFISYSHDDKIFAERLARDLDDAGLDVWIDFRRLRGGELWRDEIFNGIAQADVVVICLSPASIESEWVRREILMARGHHKRVIPVTPVQCFEMLDRYDETRWLSDIQVINFESKTYEQAFPQLLAALFGAGTLITEDMESAGIPCPFKGLEAFQQADAHLFFGRENLVDKLLARLRDGRGDRFLAVVGASGSGKSSLVRAGLIPKLRAGVLEGSAMWPVVIFTPGPRPTEAMAARLRPVLSIERSLANLLEDLGRGSMALHLLTEEYLADEPSNTRLVLIVDQFEEVFTRASPQEAATFLTLLRTAAVIEAGRTLVVLTMRADFFDRLSAYPDLAQLFEEENLVIATDMTSESLRRSIEEPAKVVGLVYEEGLCDRILEDVRQQPGSLPLLQYALKELYERRDRRQLTWAAYEQIGGVRRALAQHAEDIYSRLDITQRDIIRRLLLRLVEVSETGEAMRRKVGREMLTFQGVLDEAVTEVIQLLTATDTRLLVTSRDINPNEEQAATIRVEISHEALLREWERLAGWVVENKEELRYGGELLRAAQDWKQSGQSTDYLLAGSRLSHAELWLETADSSDLQREYIQASMIERQRQEAEEQARVQRELDMQRQVAQQRQRAANRLRYLAVSLAFFLVGAVILLAFAFGERRIAGNEANRAETQAAIAEFNASVALSAREQAQTEAVNAQTQAAVADHNAATATFAQGDALFQANISRTQAAVARHNAATATIAQGEAQKQARAAQEAQATSVRYAQEAQSFGLISGAREAIVNADRPLALALAVEANTIDNSSLEARRTLAEIAYSPGFTRFLEGHRYRVTSIAFSGDSKKAISGSCAELDNNDTCVLGETIVWDITNGQRLYTLTGYAGWVTSVALSADGQLALAGIDDGTVLLWNMATGDLLQSFSGHEGLVNSVSFGPGPYRAMPVSSSFDGTMRFWDMETGRELATLNYPSPIWTMSFAPNDVSVATVLSNSQLTFRHDLSASSLHIFDEVQGVTSLAFSPDGHLIITGTTRDTLLLWDADNQRLLRTFGESETNNNNYIQSVVFNPDGQTVWSGHLDGTASLWEVATGDRLRTFVVDGSNGPMVFSPDGRMVLTASRDGTLILWYLVDEECRVFSGELGSGTIVAFHPYSHVALSDSQDNKIFLWNVADGELLRTFQAHTGKINGLAFSPSGNKIISGSSDHMAILWDTTTGDVLHIWGDQNAEIYTVAFSPDGQMVLSGGNDGVLRLWDVASGKLIRTFTGHMGWIFGAVFSPDGQIVVSGASDRSLILWNAHTGELMRILTGHQGWVTDVTFSPDGQTILSGSRDSTVMLWSVESGNLLHTFTGHIGAITSVAFSPDGRVALSSSEDNTIRLWEISSADRLYMFTGHESATTSVAFSPDGETALSGSTDGTLRLWRIDTTSAELIAWTYANRYVREFTCDERRRYHMSLCDDNIFPTRTPYPTSWPTVIPTLTLSPALTQTTLTSTVPG